MPVEPDFSNYSRILEYRLDQAESKITAQSETIFALRAEQQAFKEQMTRSLEKIRLEEIDREKAQLRWGVAALGAAVLTLGGVLWNYRGIILK